MDDNDKAGEPHPTKTNETTELSSSMEFSNSGPVTTTTTTSALDGSFMSFNCGGGYHSAEGWCCTSPTQTKNSIIFENHAPGTFKSAKRYISQSSGVQITSCDLRTQAEQDEYCDEKHVIESLSEWRDDYIPDWFRPSDYDETGKDFIAIAGPIAEGNTYKSPNEFQSVPASPSITNPNEHFYEHGFSLEDNKVHAKEVITFTCEVTGDKTALPPGATGYHKRDYTDGLTSESTKHGEPLGMAKKTSISTELEISNDFNENYFSPKLDINNTEDRQPTENSVYSELKGILAVEGNWNKSTENYRTYSGLSWVEPFSYKSIFNRGFFKETKNIVENWKTSGDTNNFGTSGINWNIQNLKAFGFEYMKSDSDSTGEFSNKTADVIAPENSFRESSHSTMYVSDDGKVALLYSVTLGWQFVNTIGGHPITVFLPEGKDDEIFKMTEMHGPRMGNHENGRLQIIYQVGQTEVFGENSNLQLVSGEYTPGGDLEYFAKDITITPSEESEQTDNGWVVSGLFNFNQITIEASFDEGTTQYGELMITNHSAGDSVLWANHEYESYDDLFLRQPMKFIFPGTQDQFYYVYFTFNGFSELTETEDSTNVVQSNTQSEDSANTGTDGSNDGDDQLNTAQNMNSQIQNIGVGAKLGATSNGSSGASGAGDPHINTFFNETYEM